MKLKQSESYLYENIRKFRIEVFMSSSVRRSNRYSVLE